RPPRCEHGALPLSYAPARAGFRVERVGMSRNGTALRPFALTDSLGFLAIVLAMPDSSHPQPASLAEPLAAAPFAALVLAAGKGTRMRSDLPKVMHRLANRPMIQHVLAAVGALRPARTVVVVAPGMQEVTAAAAPAEIAIQREARGTADAV